MLGKGTGLAHSVLNEVISNLKNQVQKLSKEQRSSMISDSSYAVWVIRHLQKDVFYILIKLLSRINFLNQLTQPFFVQNLSHDLTLFSRSNGTWVSELKLKELVGWPPTELTLEGRLLVRAGCCPDIPDAVWWLAGAPEAWLLILHSVNKQIV